MVRIWRYPLPDSRSRPPARTTLPKPEFFKLSQRLEGKRALVTAAGQGIGRASALAMAEEGASVFATDVNEAALAEIEHPNVETFVLNVRDNASVKEGVARARPDVLFNCAGFVLSLIHS